MYCALHYGWRGVPGRKYRTGDLNVRKMHELFEVQEQAHVSYSSYYCVFTNKFNLGFGHPATEACSVCVRHKIRIKDPNMTEDEK